MNTKLKLGLALGSGSSRGWAHIGIINALSELGISANIICGTSVGAMVGAAYVTGNMDRLEKWACSLTKLDVARFIEINTSLTGFVNTERSLRLNTFWECSKKNLQLEPRFDLLDYLT